MENFPATNLENLLHRHVLESAALAQEAVDEATSPDDFYYASLCRQTAFSLTVRLQEEMDQRKLSSVTMLQKLEELNMKKAEVAKVEAETLKIQLETAKLLNEVDKPKENQSDS